MTHTRRVTYSALTVVLLFQALVLQADAPKPAGRVVEIRSYNLKAGTRSRFHQLFVTEALPLLRRARVDVVAYGASLHDDDSYFLMRAYADAAERQRSEDAFYGSDAWRQGPREAILACIDSYTTIVIQVDEATLGGLRTSGDPVSGRLR